MNHLNHVIDAIEYIEGHLAEKLDLKIVSDALHYSKYHLHRMFSDMVGLTIHDYIKRRRLTEAAKLLVFSQKTVMETALQAGYASHEAFTKAFKTMYKLTPLQYRKNELFYPLQLKYDFGGHSGPDVKSPDEINEVRFATSADIPLWMDLVSLVIDGFPNLDEKSYTAVLKRYIEEKRAFIVIAGSIAVGIMMITYDIGSIDFLGVHPLYRKQGISRVLLDEAISKMLEHKNITITTFREGDKADTGYRKALIGLGFAEGELLTEFGYPTQKMILLNKKELFEKGYME